MLGWSKSSNTRRACGIKKNLKPQFKSTQRTIIKTRITAQYSIINPYLIPHQKYETQHQDECEKSKAQLTYEAWQN